MSDRCSGNNCAGCNECSESPASTPESVTKQTGQFLQVNKSKEPSLKVSLGDLLAKKLKR